MGKQLLARFQVTGQFVYDAAPRVPEQVETVRARLSLDAGALKRAGFGLIPTFRIPVQSVWIGRLLRFVDHRVVECLDDCVVESCLTGAVGPALITTSPSCASSKCVMGAMFVALTHKE